MTTLITGGSKCGKSHIAEEILSGFAGRKIYIAAMEPYGEDALRTIERHHRMRAGKGFETIEKYTDIHEISLPKHCCVLIECMSTLLANETFSACAEYPVEKILSGIEKIEEQASELVIVTCNVGEDGIEYPELTARYIKDLGILNCALAKRCERVIEAVYGIPVVLKGKL